MVPIGIINDFKMIHIDKETTDGFILPLRPLQFFGKLFFETHDPTQTDRQGPDVGTQYRSAIFYQNNEEKETALKVISILEEKGLNVVTELNPFKEFWISLDISVQIIQNNIPQIFN